MDGNKYNSIHPDDHQVHLPGLRVLAGGWNLDKARKRNPLDELKSTGKRAESHLSAAPNQDGGPSFFPKETVKRHCHDKVYSELAGLEAVQSNGDAHCRSPALHRGRRSN
jgi:hypothetical protein